MAVINTDKYVRRQFHSNTSLWLVEIWRMSAPSSNQLIQACDWLKSNEWMVECTHAICCEEWEVPTYPSLKMSLKATSFLLARPTCHGVDQSTSPDTGLVRMCNERLTSIQHLWYQRWERGMYFLPMTTGVSKFASHMTAQAAAGTNHKVATEFECSWRVSWAAVVTYHPVAVVVIIL